MTSDPPRLLAASADASAIADRLGPLLELPGGFDAAIGLLVERTLAYPLDGIVASPSGGFLIAAAIALRARLPLISIETGTGTARSESGTAGAGMLRAGEQYAIAADILGSGGAINELIECVESAGARVDLCLVGVETVGERGRERLSPFWVEAAVRL